jgi:hypothetical protein
MAAKAGNHVPALRRTSRRKANSLRGGSQITRLYRLALDLDTSLQRLRVEAINRLSAKHWRKQRMATAWGCIGFAPLGFR